MKKKNHFNGLNVSLIIQFVTLVGMHWYWMLLYFWWLSA